MKLPSGYFQGTDVVLLARDLLGKVLVTCVDGHRTSGIITETEAYAGVTDRASHAYGGRRTPRTSTMYLPGGHSYVYLCYGIHSLFNVVTGPAHVPHAVLVRAIRPLEGTGVILHRRRASKLSPTLCNGPGKVCSALGIDYRRHDSLSLLGDEVWIEDGGYDVNRDTVTVGPRIGVDYAGDDALLPYRFVLDTIRG